VFQRGSKSKQNPAETTEYRYGKKAYHFNPWIIAAQNLRLPACFDTLQLDEVGIILACRRPAFAAKGGSVV
jgi:hypothetical protein